MKGGRHLVDGFDVTGSNDRFFRHITEQGDLGFHVAGDFAVAATQQNIRLNTDFAQILDTVLGRLGFQFSGGRDIGHQGQVDIKNIVAPAINAKLADGLKKR